MGRSASGTAVKRGMLLVLLLAVSVAAAAAEPAFLLKASVPVSGTGILGYPRLLSGQKAEYSRREAAGLRGLAVSPAIRRPAEKEHRILVVYSRTALPAEADWTPFPDSDLRLLSVPVEEGISLLYTDASGFSLLFSFDGDFAPMGAFCASFVKGLKGFLPYATRGAEVPFPAVVEWD